MSRVEETAEIIEVRDERENISNLENLNSGGKSLGLKPAKKKFQTNFAKMSNMRVIQKKLVYVIGLSTTLAFKNIQLGRFEYFGQYGKITKLVVNQNKVYNVNGPNGPSYSAYVTFSSAEECSLAILALDNAVLDGHLLRASYGTTKYCANFLKATECHNKDCLYLHYFADHNEIIDRDDMNNNKSIFMTQHILAMNIADIFNSEKYKKLMSMKGNKTVFPSPHTIYEKEIVSEQMRKFENCSHFDEKNSTPKNRKGKSRFDFASNAPESESVEIPDFVNDLISQNLSVLISRKKSAKSKDDENMVYNRKLFQEYNDNNPWARFIISQNGDETLKIALEKFTLEEEMQLLKKFKTG